MAYRIAADITVVIHLLWILFLLFGAWWGRTYRGVMILHVAGLVFAVIIQVCGWYCPLTHLEFWLRTRQGPPGAYPASFIAYYADQAVYLEIPIGLIFILTILLLIGNGVIYLQAWKRIR